MKRLTNCKTPADLPIPDHWVTNGTLSLPVSRVWVEPLTLINVPWVGAWALKMSTVFLGNNSPLAPAPIPNLLSRVPLGLELWYFAPSGREGRVSSVHFPITALWFKQGRKALLLRPWIAVLWECPLSPLLADWISSNAVSTSQMDQYLWCNLISCEASCTARSVSPELTLMTPVCFHLPPTHHCIFLQPTWCNMPTTWKTLPSP